MYCSRVAHPRLKFTISYDTLVRGGVEAKSAYVGSSAHAQDSNDPHGSTFVTCSRGVRIIPDLKLPDLAGGKALEEYDALIVPGGAKGAEIISSHQDVQKLIKAFYAKGKIVACICAGMSLSQAYSSSDLPLSGSLAAKSAGIAHDSAITSHPSVKDQLTKGKLFANLCVSPFSNTIYRLPLQGRQSRNFE